jgi:glycosyltransferase involved in cell wall biosynthesis
MQCCEGDEVIVVDDGSTDKTQEALAPNRERIVYIRMPHSGAGKARNRGLQVARNPLVAFLDSDDEWMPGKLELQRALMQARPDVLFCFSNFAVRDRRGHEHHNYLARWHREPVNWEKILGPGVAFSSIAPLPQGHDDFPVHIGNLYPSQMAAPYVLTDTLLVRRKEAGSALWFPEDLSTYEDWECFGRLARAGPAAYLARETVWQYAHAGARLTDADEMQNATARITMLRRVWGADEAFLAAYKSQFESTLREQRLKRIRVLLTHGRTRDARRELRHVNGNALPCRVLASLPGPITRLLLAVRLALRHAVRNRTNEAPQ